VGSRFRFREGGTTSSISVVSREGSGDSSFFVEALPCANREREDRVLLRDVDEREVALIILEVSFEILEVLILPVGQVLELPGKPYREVQLQSSLQRLTKGTCKKRSSPPESSAVVTGRPADQDA